MTEMEEAVALRLSKGWGGCQGLSNRRPQEDEPLTLARGHQLFTWLRGSFGHHLDGLLVEQTGWSRLYCLFGHRVGGWQTAQLPDPTPDAGER